MPVTGPAERGLINPAPGLEALQTEAPVFAKAKPHPDDGTPIPRPSTHFGLEAYLKSREARGALVEAARQEAIRDERTTGTALRDATPTGRPPARIDKSALALPEPKRLRDKNHLKYVASHACLVCGRQPADPHHLRFAQPRAIGLKVSDEFTVPLCRTHHRNLHQAGTSYAGGRTSGLNRCQLPASCGRRRAAEAPECASATHTGTAAHRRLGASPYCALGSLLGLLSAFAHDGVQCLDRDGCWHPGLSSRLGRRCQILTRSTGRELPYRCAWRLAAERTSSAPISLIQTRPWAHSLRSQQGEQGPLQHKFSFAEYPV